MANKEWNEYSVWHWCTGWLVFWCSWFFWLWSSSLGKECRWMTRALRSMASVHGQSTVWQRHLLFERDKRELKRQRSAFWPPIPTQPLNPLHRYSFFFIGIVSLRVNGTCDSLNSSLGEIGSRILPPRRGRALRWTQPMSTSLCSNGEGRITERPTDGE